MIKSIWYEFENWKDSFNKEDANSDVIFELDDGSKWAVTFFTYKNIETLRKKNELTGECLCGKYFCATDLILISVMSKELIKEVILEMIKNDEIKLYCSKL